MRASRPSRIYSIHIALIYSICEPSSCFEEERCDTLLEDCDVVTGVLQDPVIYSKTAADTGLVELQREKTGVGLNTFLVKRESVIRWALPLAEPLY